MTRADTVTHVGAVGARVFGDSPSLVGRNFESRAVLNVQEDMNYRILCAIAVVGALSVTGINSALADPPPPMEQGQPVSVPDVKMLAKSGMSDDVILSQIRNSHTVYHLSTAEIVDLKDAGVSQKVIDFMINTPSMNPSMPPPVVGAPASSPPVIVQEGIVGAAPPPVIVEAIPVSPGLPYIWIGGFWTWHRGGWMWVRGHWAVPPHRNAVWVTGGWERHGGHTVWVSGYWR